MALFLPESILPKELRDKSKLETKVDALAVQAEEKGFSLIEIRCAGDLTRAFFVVESMDQSCEAVQTPVDAITEIAHVAHREEDRGFCELGPKGHG